MYRNQHVIARFVWMLTKFWDSRPIQVAIYTVVGKESESEVKKRYIVDPGGKYQEIHILYIIKSYIPIF